MSTEWTPSDRLQLLAHISSGVARRAFPAGGAVTLRPVPSSSCTGDEETLAKETRRQQSAFQFPATRPANPAFVLKMLP